MSFGTEILIIELIGIIAFTISGAIVAIKKRFDLFGIIVLGVVTAVGGGALRDIILGIFPLAMFQKPIYVFVAFITSLIIFMIMSVASVEVEEKKSFLIELINFFDAIGLGIFAVIGTNTAIINGYENNAFLAVFVGVCTGIGGGMLRDMLAQRVPLVLYKDIYALAAVAGSTMYYYMYLNKLSAFISVTSAIVVTILIRLAALYYNLGLPKLSLLKRKNKNSEQNNKSDF